MPHRLRAVNFDPSINQVDVEDFSCGDDPWCIAANNWIRGDSVRRSIARGTQVWLYLRGDNALVGFGSLGRTRWQAMGQANLMLIPQLAIAAEFQGRQPQHVPREERYVHQVMNDLLTKAVAYNDIHFVVLEVHESNVRAINLYQSYNFTVLPDRVRKTFGGTSVVYIQMAMKVRPVLRT